MPIGKLGKIPGLGADAARILIASINGLADAVNRLAAPARTTGLQRSGYLAVEDETVRMRGGNRLTLPRARAENIGAQVRVIVETEGPVSVVATGGTVNALDVQALNLIGLYTFSHNGAGGWFSERGDRPDAGNALEYDGETLNYVGSTSLLRLTGVTGNLGTIDISTLECGGSLCIVAAAGNYQIEGFTSTPPKPEGFHFTLTASNTAVIATIFNEDSTASAADRIRCPNSEDFIGTNLQATVHAAPADGLPGGTNRWRFVAGASAPRYAVVDLVTTTGTITDLALGFNANRLRMGGGAGDRLLVSMDPGASPDGRVVIIQNIDGTSTDDIEVQHDDGATGTAAWRFLCADQVNARISSRGMGIAVYDDTSDRWYLSVVSREATRLIAVHSATAADASYSVTVPAGATWFKAFAKGGGSGGGGADSDTNLEATAGGGGGEGCEMELWIPVSAATITGAIGAGGTAGTNTGGSGGVGGGTTVIHDGSTYTANQGAVGIGTAAGPVAAPGAKTAGGAGGGGALTAGANIAFFSKFVTGQSGAEGLMFPAAAIGAEWAMGGDGAGPGGGRGGTQLGGAGAANGANAVGQGCGGGGGARLTAGAAVGATGGTGSPGYVRFEFYSGPVPTFSAVT